MKQIWPRNHVKGQAVQCFPLTRIIAFSGCLERSQVFKAHVKSLNQISPNVSSVRRCLPSTHTLLNSSTSMPSWSPKHLAATRMCLELVCDTVTNIHVYLLPLYINQTFFFLPNEEASQLSSWIQLPTLWLPAFHMHGKDAFLWPAEVRYGHVLPHKCEHPCLLWTMTAMASVSYHWSCLGSSSWPGWDVSVAPYWPLLEMHCDVNVNQV